MSKKIEQPEEIVNFDKTEYLLQGHIPEKEKIKSRNGVFAWGVFLFVLSLFVWTLYFFLVRKIGYIEGLTPSNVFLKKCVNLLIKIFQYKKFIMIGGISISALSSICFGFSTFSKIIRLRVFSILLMLINLAAIWVAIMPIIINH